MQFQVPQFIETEDKIVGPLSLRQFGYIAAAGVVIFVLYFLVEAWLFFLGSAILLAIAAALAFIKIHGRPLSGVVVSAFNFYWKPQSYIWRPEESKTPEEEFTDEFREKGISMEDIVSGAALRNVWKKLQTGEGRVSSRQFFEKMDEKYQILQQAAGDRKAARRVDYR